MKYSVVIPTYNNEKNLFILLASLDLQNYSRKEYEVIVVDDGSDVEISTLYKNENFSFELRIFRIERDCNSCRSKARNLGWKNSRGVYVVFLDSDIVINKNYFSELDRYSELLDDSLIVGMRIHVKNGIRAQDIYSDNIRKFFEINKNDFSRMEYRYLVFSSSSFNAFSVEHSWVHAYSCNMCVSRFNLDKINGFDENFINWGGEDIELAYRLSKIGVELVLNKDLEVLHQSQSVRDDIVISEKKQDGYKKNINYLIEKHSNILNKPAEEVHNYLNGGMRFENKINTFCKNKLSVKCYSLGDVASLKGIIKNYIGDGLELIVFDYTSGSGLDIFIQSFRKKSKIIKYFPMNKVINVDEMNAYYGLS